MGLFGKKELIVLKEDTSAREQIEELKELSSKAKGTLKAEIENQIFLLQKGVEGEDEILFQLKYADMDMVVLRDLHLVHDGISAQIDLLVITPKIKFIIECKNLIGDITVDRNGNFIRSYQTKSGKKVKEGIESPITQNERHMLLVKKLQQADKGFLISHSIEKNFDTFNKSLVVLANSKTILNDRYAPKDVKNKIIRADQLVDTIKNLTKASNEMSSSKKEMLKTGEKWLSRHVPNDVDYLADFKERLAIQEEASAKADDMICPFCGNELIVRNGKRGEFIGCSGFPKCRYTRNLKTSDEIKEEKDG